MSNENCCTETKTACCKEAATHWTPCNCCSRIREIQDEIRSFLPESRERSVLLTKLDDAYMWAKGAFTNGN